MRAFALSTAFAIICFAPPAIAAQFDGNWNMVAVTTSGHCGRVPIGIWSSYTQAGCYGCSEKLPAALPGGIRAGDRPRLLRVHPMTVDNVGGLRARQQNQFASAARRSKDASLVPSPTGGISCFKPPH
jgi:hypothetical protein